MLGSPQPRDNPSQIPQMLSRMVLQLQGLRGEDPEGEGAPEEGSRVETGYGLKEVEAQLGTLMGTLSWGLPHSQLLGEQAGLRGRRVEKPYVSLAAHRPAHPAEDLTGPKLLGALPRDLFLNCPGPQELHPHTVGACHSQGPPWSENPPKSHTRRINGALTYVIKYKNNTK